MSKATTKRQKTLGLKQKRQDPKLSLDESDSDMKNLMDDLPPSDSVTIPKSNSPLFKMSVMQNFDASFDSDDDDNMSEVDKDLEEYMKQNGAAKKRNLIEKKKKANKESLRLNVLKSRSGRVVKPKVFDDDRMGKVFNKSGKGAEPKITKKKVVKAKPESESEESSDEDVSEVAYDPSTDRHTVDAAEEDKEAEIKTDVPELRRSRPGRTIKPKRMDDFVVGRIDKHVKENRKKVEVESDNDSSQNKSTDTSKGRGRPKKSETLSPSPQKPVKPASVEKPVKQFGRAKKDTSNTEVESKSGIQSEKETISTGKRGRPRKSDPEEVTPSSKPNASLTKKEVVAREMPKPAQVKLSKKEETAKLNQESQLKKEESITKKVVIPVKKISPEVQKTIQENQQKKEGTPKLVQTSQPKVETTAPKVVVKSGRKEIIISDTQKLVRLSESDNDETPVKKIVTQGKKEIIIRQVPKQVQKVVQTGVSQQSNSDKNIAIRKIVVNQTNKEGVVRQVQKHIQISKPLTQMSKVSLNTGELGQKKIVSVPQGSILVKKDGIILRRVPTSEVKGKMTISPQATVSKPISLPQGITISKQSMVTSTPLLKQGSKISIVRKILPSPLTTPIRVKPASAFDHSITPIKVQPTPVAVKKISSVKSDGAVSSLKDESVACRSPVFVPVDIGSILSKPMDSSSPRPVSFKSSKNSSSQGSTISAEQKSAKDDSSGNVSSADTVRAQRAREIAFLKKRLKELEMLQEIDEKATAAAAAKRKMDSSTEEQSNVKRLKKVTQGNIMNTQRTLSITPKADETATMDTDDPLG